MRSQEIVTDNQLRFHVNILWFYSCNNSCIQWSETMGKAKGWKLRLKVILNLGKIWHACVDLLNRNIRESFKLTPSMWTLTWTGQDVFELDDWHTHLMSWRLMMRWINGVNESRWPSAWNSELTGVNTPAVPAGFVVFNLKWALSLEEKSLSVTPLHSWWE